jgi:NTP pyrophosphatase (non-canonical NTP hydrolase)
MKTIKELQKEAHSIAKSKGFWDNTERVINFLKDCEDELVDESMNNIISTKLALIHSEISEALEGLRKKNKEKFIIPSSLDMSDSSDKMFFEDYIKNGVEDELADAVIRIFDICEWLGIDLENHVIMKMNYNKTRPYKHGKTF